MSSLRLITYSFTDKHSAQVLPVFSLSTSIYLRSASFSPLLRRLLHSVQAVVKKIPSAHFFSALNARTANVKLGSNQCHATLESELTFSVWVCVDLVGESDDV